MKIKYNSVAPLVMKLKNGTSVRFVKGINTVNNSDYATLKKENRGFFDNECFEEVVAPVAYTSAALPAKNLGAKPKDEKREAVIKTCEKLGIKTYHNSKTETLEKKIEEYNAAQAKADEKVSDDPILADNTPDVALSEEGKAKVVESVKAIDESVETLANAIAEPEGE